MSGFATDSMVPIEPIDPNVHLVHHFLERSARLFPDKVALIHGAVRATYAEINNRANNLACYLVSVGVEKGDRIASLMENSLEYVVSYYGIMKAEPSLSLSTVTLSPKGCDMPLTISRPNSHILSEVREDHLLSEF